MNDIFYLCATTRLAQRLRGIRPTDAAVWRTGTALTLAQWLAGLADEARLAGVADLPMALDPFAESLLWEKLIADSLTEAGALFDIQGMAASALEAHALAQIWGIRSDPGLLSDEARLFIGWRTAFETHCRRAGWIDLAGLQGQVIGLIEAGHFVLPASVHLAGFDRPTPLEERLAKALRERGVVVENSPEKPVDRSQCQVQPCADSAAECVAVAAWAKAKLAANPDCRLGIVAPNLAGVRDALEFTLDATLHPGFARPDTAELPRCFNFSLGCGLAEQALVRVALDLLSLGSARAKIEQSRLSALLLAGGWAAADSEADGRARLDLAMRRDLPYFTTLNALIRLAHRLEVSAPALCPQTLVALEAFADLLASATKSLRPGAWAPFFRRALKLVGWPGERALSSHEFQARRAFYEVLERFGQLDALLGQCSLREATRRLAQVCRQRIFQPETRGQPSIQVLGVLESAGLEFDALWVMGMNDDVWPPPPRPNPMLPIEALRAAGAAHASAEVELDFAQRVHARLRQAAPEVTFSFARADGNRVLRPSPLLAGLPMGEALPPLVASLASSLAAESGNVLAQVDDAFAPPVTEGEKVSGGSWLLRAQAICPAWAYYQFRLGAAAMEIPVEGLDPAARGTLVHGALEVFWRSVGSSNALGELDEIARQQQINVAVAEALDVFEHERRTVLPARFRLLEAARLAKLLDLWLDVEMRRGEAFSVLACEQSAEVEIEGIRVKMVVDRIDQLADERQVIIDYKTGAAIDIANWAEQRITEPQLPIYAALVNDEVAAVVFAKVLRDKPGFTGVADEKDILPGVQGIGDDKQKIFDPAEFPDWIAVITHWRERLHAVAREVKEGQAGVMFGDEKLLQYCEVLPLLRLPERCRLLAAALAEKSG